MLDALCFGRQRNPSQHDAVAAGHTGLPWPASTSGTVSLLQTLRAAVGRRRLRGRSMWCCRCRAMCAGAAEHSRHAPLAAGEVIVASGGGSRQRRWLVQVPMAMSTKPRASPHVQLYTFLDGVFTGAQCGTLRARRCRIRVAVSGALGRQPWPASGPGDPSDRP